jgi:hypothetical protein
LTGAITFALAEAGRRYSDIDPSLVNDTLCAAYQGVANLELETWRLKL